MLEYHLLSCSTWPWGWNWQNSSCWLYDYDNDTTFCRKNRQWHGNGELRNTVV